MPINLDTSMRVGSVVPSGTRPFRTANDVQNNIQNAEANGALQPAERLMPGQTTDIPTIDGAQERSLKLMGKIKCETCSTRKYQDGSGDGGVSFKSAQHVAPEGAAGAVAAHENEHIFRDGAKARSEGREVVSQSVRIFTDKCPECGRVYVSGGEARTVSQNKPETQQQQVEALLPGAQA